MDDMGDDGLDMLGNDDRETVGPYVGKGVVGDDSPGDCCVAGATSSPGGALGRCERVGAYVGKDVAGDGRADGTTSSPRASPGRRKPSDSEARVDGAEDSWPSRLGGVVRDAAGRGAAAVVAADGAGDADGAAAFAGEPPAVASAAASAAQHAAPSRGTRHAARHRPPRASQ